MGRSRSDVRVIHISAKSDMSDLRKIDRGLDDLAATFEDVQDEIRDTGRVSDETAGKLSSLVNGALRGVGLAIGNLVTSAATDAISGFASDTLGWSEALNQLKATTDLTESEFADLKDSAFDLFSNNFGENVNDITNKLGIAQRTTNLMGDDLEQIVMQSERWGEFGADFEEGVRASNQVMNNFGIDAERAGDAITSVFVRAGDPQGELLDTFNEYSSTFAQMGFDADEFARVLVDGADEGIFSYDRLADAGREFGIRLREGISNDAIADAYDDLFAMTDSVGFHMADGTQFAIDSYADLVTAMEEGGVSQRAIIEQVSGALLEIEDPLERNRIAAELFGTQFEDLGDGVIEAFDGIDGAMGETEGAFDEMDAQLSQGLGETLNTLKRTISVELFKAIEPFLAQIVAKLIPAIQDFAKLMKKTVIPLVEDFADEWIPKATDVVEELTDAVSPLIDTISDWISEQQWLIDLIGRFAPKIAIAAGIVAGLVAAFTGVSVVIAIVTGALALLSLPILVIIGLLAGLMVAWETNFLGIRDLVTGAIPDILNALMSLFDFFSGAIDAFKEGGLSGLGDFIKTQLIDPLVSQVSEYVGSGALWDDVKGLGASLIDALKDGLDIVTNGATLFYDQVIKPLADQALEYVTSGEAWDNIKSLASAYINLLKYELDIFSQGATLIYDNIIKPIADQLIEYVSSGEAWDNIKSLASGYFDLLKAELNIAQKASTFIYDQIISPLATQALEYVTSGEAWDNIKSLASAYLDLLKMELDVAAKASTLIKDNILDPIVDQITNLNLEGLVTAVTAIGDTIIDTLSGVISAGAGAVGSAIKSAINAAIPNSVGFTVPSLDLGLAGTIGGQTYSLSLPDPFPGYQFGTAFTGFGALNQVAGLVHHQEAVVPASGLAVFPDPRGLQLRGAMAGDDKIHITLYLDSQVLLDQLEIAERTRAPA